MKRNVLLVTNSGDDLNDTVAKAASKTKLGIRETSTSRNTFEILEPGLDDVDLAIVNVDPILHSLTILEALNDSEAAPPIIVLVDVDEAEATSLVLRHGAAACLRKPFGSDQLAILIEKVCASACRNKPLSCDKWANCVLQVFEARGGT
jgi:DNA-binding response OmpR family regulator